jgi:hypothetical protein
MRRMSYSYEAQIRQMVAGFKNLEEIGGRSGVTMEAATLMTVDASRRCVCVMVDYTVERPEARRSLVSALLLNGQGLLLRMHETLPWLFTNPT